MNKKTILSTMLVLVALTAQSQVHYRLEGNIGDSTFTGKATLRDLYVHSGTEVATVNITNGKINPVEGELPDTTICGIIFDDGRMHLFPVFLGGGTTTIIGKTGLFRPKQIGTSLCEDYILFKKKESEVTSQWLIERMKKFRGGTGTVSTADMGKEETGQIEATAIDVISRHTSDILGLYLLREEAVNYLTPATWLEMFDKIAPWLKTKPDLYEDLTFFKSMMESKVKTGEGTKFIDVEAEVDGKICRLSDYVGKGRYILADFWGSTCTPCLAQMPKLNEIHQKYQSCGLTVLGIAVSEDAKKSRAAIEKHHITFPQLLNTQTKAMETYGILSVPYSILFAPDGTIIARGPLGEAIEKKLAEIFNDK